MQTTTLAVEAPTPDASPAHKHDPASSYLHANDRGRRGQEVGGKENGAEAGPNVDDRPDPVPGRHALDAAFLTHVRERQSANTAGR